MSSTEYTIIGLKQKELAAREFSESFQLRVGVSKMARDGHHQTPGTTELLICYGCTKTAVYVVEQQAQLVQRQSKRHSACHDSNYHETAEAPPVRILYFDENVRRRRSWKEPGLHDPEPALMRVSNSNRGSGNYVFATARRS